MWECTWELWEGFLPALTYVKEEVNRNQKSNHKWKTHHEWKHDDLEWAENMDNLISQKVNSVSITYKNSIDKLVVINQIIKTHLKVSQTRKPLIEKTKL